MLTRLICGLVMYSALEMSLIPSFKALKQYVTMLKHGENKENLTIRFFFLVRVYTFFLEFRTKDITCIIYIHHIIIFSIYVQKCNVSLV